MKKGRIIAALLLTAALLAGVVLLGRVFVSLVTGGAQRLALVGEAAVEEAPPWETDAPRLGVDQEYDAPDDTPAPENDAPLVEAPVDQLPEELEPLY